MTIRRAKRQGAAPRNLRLPVTAFIGLVVAAVITACGGGTPTPHPAADQCTNAATVTARDPYPTAAVLPPDDELHCRIRAALLSASDLPGGWTRAQFVPAPGADRVQPSGNISCVEAVGLIGGLETGFELDSETGAPEALGEEILIFASGDAARFMARFRELAQPDHPCSDFEFSPLDLPPLGDESVAHTSAPVDEGSLVTKAVAIRRGDVVTLITQPLAGANTLTIDEFTRLADARVANEAALLNSPGRCGTPVAALDGGWTRC